MKGKNLSRCKSAGKTNAKEEPKTQRKVASNGRANRKDKDSGFTRVGPLKFPVSFKWRRRQRSSGPSSNESYTNPPNNTPPNSNKSSEPKFFDAITESRSHFSDDDDSTCSLSFEGDDVVTILIAPVPQRLSASSPPITMFDINADMHNGVGANSFPRSSSRSRTFTPSNWARRSRSKSKGQPFLSAQTTPQIRAPHLSDEARKYLSPVLLGNYQHSIGKELDCGSAWKRPTPCSSTRNVGRPSASSYTQYNLGEMTTTASRRPSSDSSEILPPFMSPAYRFTPIGCEFGIKKDDSFDEGDYDICKYDNNEKFLEPTQPAASPTPCAAHCPSPDHSLLASKELRQCYSEKETPFTAIGQKLRCSQPEVMDVDEDDGERDRYWVFRLSSYLENSCGCNVDEDVT